jgi:hypothetical protein
VARGLNAYALLQFVGALLLAIGLLVAGGALSRAQLFVAVLVVLWTLVNIGGIFDHRPWTLVSEVARLPAVAILVATNVPDCTAVVLAGLTLSVAAMWLFLLSFRHHFGGATLH